MDRQLFGLLDGLSVLKHLPSALLGQIVKYAVLPSVQGRFVDMFEVDIRYCGLSSIACSRDGTELLVLNDCNCMQVFSLVDGHGFRLLRSWGSEGSGPGQFIKPRSICVDKKTGNVLVADFGNHRVQEFHLDGTFVRSIGNVEPGQLVSPWGVAVDSVARLIYVSEVGNHRISVFSLEDGRFVHCFGSQGTGDSEFTSPLGLHFDEERQLLLIADCTNHRVVVVRSDGSLVRILGDGSYGSGENQLSCPQNVTMDGSGEVLVPDCGNNRIQVFCIETGQPLRRFGSPGHEGGHLRFPTGVWWNPVSGRLSIIEWGTRRISIFE